MKRALVVDDSIAMRLAVGCILEDLGYENIAEAENGLDALQHMSEAEVLPSLIMMDWNMPIASGDYLIGLIRAEDRYNHIRVVAMSSNTDQSVHGKAIELGADAFIHKPFDQTTLASALQKLGLHADCSA